MHFNAIGRVTAVRTTATVQTDYENDDNIIVENKSLLGDTYHASCFNETSTRFSKLSSTIVLKLYAYRYATASRLEFNK
ncbi:hypothetical protein V1478_005949 [Vespula squamosa]|uniref:Uncharacterized protein n=1 Tax=Vespula squamosa TaxID=30214 RepID=A0ABD2BAD9_VESSQ